MANRKRKIVQADELMKLICTKTGMGQQDFEILLEVKQSMISRYLKGIRTLSATAMIKIAKIYVKVRDMPAATSLQPADADREAMATHASWCRFQAANLQKKITEMELGQQQAGNMLQLISTDFMGETLTPTQQLWTEGQQYAMEIKLAKNSWMALQQLRMQMALLIKEAELNEQYT